MPDEQISQSLKERLTYIDFQLYFFGSISRSDLMGRFGIKQAAATRDIAYYKKLAIDNIKYDQTKKTYLYSGLEKPYFDYNPHHVLSVLARGFSSHSFSLDQEPLITCESPLVLNTPKLECIANLTRAIKQNKVINLNYSSIEHSSIRAFVPFALVNSGLKWYVRGFDRARQNFHDLVLTRISSSEILEESPKKHETKEGSRDNK